VSERVLCVCVRECVCVMEARSSSATAVLSQLRQAGHLTRLLDGVVANLERDAVSHGRHAPLSLCVRENP
jgi:hypothetical protein